MKKFCITFLFIFIIILTAVVSPKEQASQEYLRIHIRAHSDVIADQSVKYQIRDRIVALLTPILSECDTKQKAKTAVLNNISEINCITQMALLEHGFDYSANSYLHKEEFPLRVYDGITLDKGVYEALIIELGEGEGANWWCVVYPPLCFTGEGTGNLKYRSKIAEIINDFKHKHLS